MTPVPGVDTAADPVTGTAAVGGVAEGGQAQPPAPAETVEAEPPMPIAEYAVLGDRQTAALVSRTGSVDWMCLPGFDSPACFAALLGTPENGRWLLTVQDATEVTRRYLDDSFVLETTYVTPTGRAAVVECMPMADERADMVRRVEVLEGHVDRRARVDRAVRVRQGPPVGAPGQGPRREAGDPRHGRSGLAAPAR